ncbi:ralBP1-associated Eps domain-containing protein 1 [Anopheles cruzii]|uniref:ralBP1-associated Eps domain-containing protein 1 n=1 Tax=Anopheles cruzii TaxID=68878 RepID=UPI0022EC8E6B|nr:ralBP1-associated Eps domain-containing protein 1 [Anopheles cruzii]
MDELSEAELRYYNDLFKICSETDSGGKVPALKATSLFRSANLSNETINKITSLVGIPQTALYLSRQQFYGCLKLIAAYQASVPLREEILTTSLNLPLPQFSWIDPVAGPPSASSTSDPVVSNATAGGATSAGTTERNGFVEGKHHRPGGSNITAVKHLPLVPSSGGSGSGQQQDSSASTGGELTNSDQPSTDSEVEHNDDGSGSGSMIRGERERHTVGMLKGGGVVMVGGTHPVVGGGGGGAGGAGGSPEAWSTASDSPTPTNSVAERPWANQNLWQGLVCEEQRQLLGTEEESSDRHSSDDEEQEIDLEYFYQISQTQKDYYLKQFRTIQPDVHGLVSGPVARVFFEKSRIPIDELRHIWQMCDVTRDGALNLAEFTAAMHLVVLRRNNIPVPATLPPCLLPTLLQHSLLQPSTGGSKGTGTAEVSATGVSGGSNGTAAVPERTEPAEADLLHLESDDNLESGSKRKRVVTVKSSRRMVPVPDSLAFAKIGGSGSAGVVPAVPQDSPPVSVSSSATGSGSVALATKGSGSSSGSSGSGSSGSGPVNTGGSSTTGGRKTPPNMSPPVLAQQPPPPQPLPAATKGKPSEHPVTPPNEKNLKKWEEWTKFMESPTSNVSSPGPKPVNFDLQRTTQAIVSDPQILHPVPLRVTPVGAEAVDNSSLVYSDANHGLLAVQSTEESSPKQNVQSQQQHHSTPQQQRDSLTNSSDLRAIQRPQSKKPPSKGVGAIPPPPQRESGSNALLANDTSMTISLDGAGFAVASAPAPLAKKSSVDQQQPPPPLPPPRPSAHRHTRSSSLDLNKLKLATGASVAPLKMPPPPEIPPRVVTPPTADQPPAGTTNHAFADFTHFPTGHRGATAMVEANNITTIHLDAAGNMTHHSTPHRGSGTLPKSLVMHTAPRQSAFEVYRKPLTADGARTVRGSQSPPQQPPLVTSRSVESSAVVNSGDYDKRISALSDSLRQVRFKSNDPPPVMADALKQLKEQNLLLLRVCNDLSEELLHIQQKREDIRIKIELQEQILGGGNALVAAATTGPSSLPASVTATHHLSHHHANL